MRQFILVLLIAVYGVAVADDKCSGSFINPITDVCWSCMFPIYISPLPPIGYSGQKGAIAMEKTSIKSSPDVIPYTGICLCPDRALTMLGMLMSFYEPYRSVDITKDAFCLVGLGGINLGNDLSNLLPSPGYGDEETHGMQTKSSFYQMHWYLNPILEILEVIDLSCTMGQDAQLDLEFISEVDPSWNDDDLSFIFSPDTVLFASLPAQMSCSMDCIGDSLTYNPPGNQVGNVYLDTGDWLSVIGKTYTDNNISNPAANTNPSKDLYWCGGCQGALFPLDGNNIDNMQEIQTSILSAEKANMLVHRMGLEMTTTGAIGMCTNIVPDLLMDKSEWKYSMTFPRAQALGSGTCCNAFGASDVPWNSGASYPIQGENFSYLWYHERDCCSL